MRRNTTHRFLLTVEPEDADSYELEVYVELSPYDPGRRFGPPEDCYPPEGGEVKSIEVYRDGKEIELDDELEALIFSHIERNEL